MAIKTCPTCKTPVVVAHVYGSGKFAPCPEHAEDAPAAADEEAQLQDVLHAAEAREARRQRNADTWDGLALLRARSAEDEEAADFVALVLDEDDDG